jgi:hypothetical protein
MTGSLDRIFLVRFGGKYFYLARTPGDQRMHGTLYMSYALRMSYRTACEVALRIRELGWKDALVTDLNGDAVSYDTIPAEEYTPGLDERELETAWDQNVKATEAEVSDGPVQAAGTETRT